MFSLIPNEMVFFDLFEEAARTAHAGAPALQELLNDVCNVADKVKRIKDIEHAGDKITHTTIEKWILTIPISSGIAALLYFPLGRLIQF
jgi:uncharacterized protein Yka (UPF0111/DUF47 family)